MSNYLSHSNADRGRNRGFETGWLQGAEAHGCAAGFAEAVIRRLDGATDVYGHDGFLRRPIHELFEELEAEALDLGGWAVLIEQRLGVESDRSADDRRTLDQQLQHVAALGALASALITRLRSTYEDAISR